ncbi:MAG: ABC transporter ATP-binding protein, partial [Firmicutes bacterium]|nr:ABC transporter ATP-binding protein [Bacillota bacterium]
KIISESASSKFFPTYVPAGKGGGKITWQQPEERACAIQKKEKAPLLSVEKLCAGYEGRDVLHEISFSAYPGETLAVMGDNGSGKSTLLLSLLGILKPSRGKIYLNKEDITDMKVARRARLMGLNFQNPNHQLFENTVAREAKLPSLFLSKDSPEEIECKVDQLLTEFGLYRYKDHNPFTLSLGEKKRLALVSVLAYSPLVLVLDEPLVGQDSGRLDLLMTALQKHCARGGVTLMVCHEPGVVISCCQRILFLGEGKLLIDAAVPEALVRLAQMGREEYLPMGYKLTTPGERGGFK